MRVLLLGGTTEAMAMARALAAARVEAVYSLAGRTVAPEAPPLPTRIGGFGGAEGLARYLMAGAISHVIDATHPFAARISGNAAAAWVPGPGDRWTAVPDIAAAVAALPAAPARIFLAIGRQEIAAFAAHPQHHYLLRLVDPPEAPLPFPAGVVIARGPFTEDGDRALLQDQGIDLIVAKNAGGTGAVAKLHAARALGLPVILVDRPALPPRPTCATPAEVMHWLAHARLGV
jgi:precorrin-6A/cobalt-precorrin-6A reductase